jgi:hypothetical protein
MKGIDKAQQLQSEIDPELLFRRNSINLYIGRRGSGKTYNVMRELIKLSHLPGYNLFVYITDMTSDKTVNEMLSLIKLKVKVVSYKDAVKFVPDLISAKDAYDQVIEKGLRNAITEECKDDLFASVDIDRWTNITPCTVILYDDAINSFKQTHNKPLLDLLFQNRQPKITYFLCMQDGFALPPQIKRNLDSCMLFGGFTDKMAIQNLFRQLNSSTVENRELQNIYDSLGNRDALLFDYLRETTLVKVVDETGECIPL